MKKIPILVLLTLLFTSCIKVKSFESHCKREFYSNGFLENELRTINSKTNLFISFDSLGYLSQLKILGANDLEETLYFYPNGKLESKYFYDKKTKQVQGISYEFYETGVIKSEKNGLIPNL